MSSNKKKQSIPLLFSTLTDKINQVNTGGASSTSIRKKTFCCLMALVLLGLNNLL